MKNENLTFETLVYIFKYYVFRFFENAMKKFKFPKKG